MIPKQEKIVKEFLAKYPPEKRETMLKALMESLKISARKAASLYQSKQTM